MENPPPEDALIVSSFVEESEDDLVGLWQIVGRIMPDDKESAFARERVLGIVCSLLREGLVAGDPPYSQHGYRPWPDQSPGYIVKRIRSEWLALGRLPTIPDIVWFSRPGLDWDKPVGLEER